MIKIGKAIDKDDIDMAAKWQNEKYGTFIRDKVVPPSIAWRFDPSLLRSAPSSE
jgi:hypothetical protein